MSADKLQTISPKISQAIGDDTESELSENESTHLEQDAESSDDPDKEMYKNLTEEQLRRAREHNECFICNKRFKSFANFRNHVVGHTNTKKFVCEICSKAFAKLTYLKAHLTIHNDNRIFTCEICSQNFATKSSVRGHMRIHSGEKRYKCDVCDRAFTESSTRRKHRMTHFGGKRKIYPSTSSFTCEYCGKVLRRQYNFKKHLKLHTDGDKTGTQRQRCPVCNKLVKCLTTHIKNHEKIPNIKCDLCDAMFKNSRSFKKHREKHTTEKHYSCDALHIHCDCEMRKAMAYF